ncbi:MAG TPA: acetylornithine transaminase [Candidatus Hydrogenedentes bacterium]|jgi:predicted acetylornithine/succinylornithine family transaminase|nr:acetylornithine transaminase [Candidatus Hydrogenedentota bacterium]HOD95130.1 acetylornithine transaminase [Candidatus Hydrogenedentota bacterium]HOR51629.1 acetylornithine transaminase [Candidatus Hydrogenedentota bacterium]HPX86046.1 acetylornithine transaminase [Candidatus Hydrogenedentota bacterium]HQB02806.1 acetylornithine transaminase [Candidatus Hydrogenedentota bacterium]
MTTLNTQEIKTLNTEHILNTYGDRRLALVRGEGARVWDAEGREYLDFFAGIAVCNLGHCHPKVTEAICTQAKKLVHVSNLYYIEPQVKLAEKLSRHCFADKWFFCNGGAEANEAAIKLARRYWTMIGANKPEIVVAEHSFHGRTLGALSATGQPKYHYGFDPLVPGFHYVPYDDLKALDAAITPQVGLVILEPIQGEGGVRVPSPGYLPGVRRLCSDKNVLLAFDEVQTGLGRTGTLFAYAHENVIPDIITLAKGLGNGVPIGAMGCTEKLSEGFSPGAHACTFGGNPLSAAAALATFEVLTEPGLVEKSAEMGAYFIRQLVDLSLEHKSILEVRGRGLMIGIEFDREVAPLVAAMHDAGILCGIAGPRVLRFLPPLIIDSTAVDCVIAALEASLEALQW